MSITARELIQLLKTGQPDVIDVRDEDFSGFKIRGALNIPSESFVQRMDSLDRNKEYVVHCMFSQVRGPAACKCLIEKGFKARLLVGGVQGFLQVDTEREFVEIIN